MPKEYLECKKSYMDKGISEKVASARCAAMYYKRHGITVNEAAKKAGEATFPIDEALVNSILSVGSQKVEATLPLAEITDKLKSEVIATKFGDYDDDNLFEIVATRVGAKAFTNDGYIVTWRDDTLNKMAVSWTGGAVTANHSPTKQYGSILASWYESPEVHQLLWVNDEMKGWITRNREFGLGVSIEANEIEHKDGEIMGAHGTATTIVFPPHDPACSPNEGCKIMGTEMETVDGAKLSYKQREDLPESAFCGPDRSFPAHDAAHVRNGLARLPQSNFSSEEKAKIKGCLESRAKKYGIDVSSIVSEEDIVVGEKPTLPEEGDVDNGEQTMSENAVVAADLVKTKNDLDSAQKTIAELQKFKDEAISKEKETSLGVIATFVDATPYKDAPLCTLRAVESALGAYATKLKEAPIKTSGAVEATTKEIPKPVLPAGFKDEAEYGRVKEAAVRAAKYGRKIEVN